MSDVDTSPTRADGSAPPRRRIGVLLVNLGTPDATDYASMRRYLREFLSDRRVIEENPVKWWLVLNLIVLTVRPGRKGRDYDKIWNRERDESPLKTVTRSQAEKLGRAMSADPRVTVDWAMRYGNPSIPSRLAALQAAGCDRILVIPLYPQYAAPTTATVCDKVFDALKTMRWQPSVRIAPPWFDDRVYIDAVANSVQHALGGLSFVPEVLIASFHGMPEDYVRKGDPYRSQCVETVRLLRERLRRTEDNLLLTFQSRFGPREWLKPYTDETVRELAKKGVKSIAVVTPGFTADCLETLEEIAMENAAIFRKAGGRNFAFIPCLNDSDDGMSVIRRVAVRELSGWI